MKKNKPVLGVAVLLLLVILVYLFRDRIHFDFVLFLRQIRHIDYRHVAAGVALIYGTYLFRSWRWTILLRALKPVPPLSLTGSNFIGFTAVALFGRLADLTRPYIISRKTEVPLAAQMAIYTIERMFDLGAAALVFSTALLFLPKDMPRHETFVRVGVLSLAATLAIAGFAFAIRIAGPALASFARAIFSRISPKLGESVHEKILSFREGLTAIPGVGAFLLSTAISLMMWCMIAGAYLQTAHAFVETPQLAQLSFPRTMLLMAASLGGSLLQLPVIGWFTQIAATAVAMQGFYSAPIEAATGCGAMLLIVTSLSIIPMGLIFARIEQVSLSKVTKASEEAGEQAIA